LAWNSTCFGHFLCPSSGFHSLCTQQWCMSYRFEDSFRAGPFSKAVYKLVWHITLLSVQWINSWWWTGEVAETCRVSRQNKFLKLVHLVCFIIKKNEILYYGFNYPSHFKIYSYCVYIYIYIYIYLLTAILLTPGAVVLYTFTHKHPMAVVQYTFMAVVQYTFTHKQYAQQHS
jgi:hypothetical protein